MLLCWPGCLCAWLHEQGCHVWHSVYYIMCQMFSAFHWKRVNQHNYGCTLGTSILKQKCTFVTIFVYTSKGRLQMDLFAQLLYFYAKLHLCSGSPLIFFAALESTTGTFHTAMKVMSSDNLANCVTSSISRTDTKHVVGLHLHCKQD